MEERILAEMLNCMGYLTTPMVANIPPCLKHKQDSHDLLRPQTNVPGRSPNHSAIFHLLHHHSSAFDFRLNGLQSQVHIHLNKRSSVDKLSWNAKASVWVDLRNGSANIGPSFLDSTANIDHTYYRRISHGGVASLELHSCAKSRASQTTCNGAQSAMMRVIKLA